MNTEIPTPTKGLSAICNLGNTCYMNSALQIVFGIDSLNDYLKQVQKGRDNENTIILTEWLDLYGVMSNDNVVVQPVRFLKKLQKVAQIKNNELFMGFDQNDATEFFHFFIDCLHESVKNIDKSMKYNNVQKSRAFGKYISNIEKHNMSIIQKLFSGYVEVSYNYNNKAISQQYEHFFTIHVPLSQMDASTLEECICNYFNDEELSGDNAYYFEKENKKVDVIKKSKIIHLPEILTIHLKRWNYMNLRKNKKRVVFQECIDMKQYCIDKHIGNSTYELFGVINHTGNVFGGHYYSHVKKSDKNWYLFNDTQIKRVSSKEIVTDKSYCLFYRKIK